MASSKRYYENFDCVVDPQKLTLARVKKGMQQGQVASMVPGLQSYDISRIEKSKTNARINFGVAKAVAKVLGVHYTKFVTLAPNQISKPTQWCKRMPSATVVPSTSAPEPVPTAESNRPELIEDQTPQPVMIDAVPTAMIFKDAAGRELRYVLADTNVA